VSLALAPLWCIGLLALLLLAAAVEDALRLKISNRTTGAILILTVATMIVVGFQASVWQNVAVFAALLAIGTLLFASGKLGGGDVKLLAVCGLWFPLMGSLHMLAAVFLAGGVLALLIILARSVRRGEGESSLLFMRPGAGIPYGIAIAAGVLLAVGYERRGAAQESVDRFRLPTNLSSM
jgi:prepilin peptidase CpaA